MAGVLEGVRVLDLTTVLLGPWAAQTLGDMGADVIKVETPAGDLMRQLGPRNSDDMGSVHLGLNRNKRSVVIDLKRAQGRDVLLTLGETADVMLHNLRPSVARKLSIEYGDLQSVNPDIIYCAACGFRAGGPYENKPAYDDVIQGACGLADLQSSISGEPRYVPSAAADKITAMAVVSAITGALFHRERHGGGQSIEVPMYETMVSFLMVEHLYGQSFEPPKGPSGYPRVLSPHRRPFATKDGFLSVLPYSDDNWVSLFTVAKRTDLLADPRFENAASRLAHIGDAYKILGEILCAKTSAQWLEILDAANIPVMPVNSTDDLLGEPQLASSEFWKLIDHPTEGRLRMTDPPVSFSKSPSGIWRAPPHLGEHSVEVLREAGYSRAQIEAFETAGAIGVYRS